MTSIQCLLTSNCSSEPLLYSKREAMAIVTPKVAAVARRATNLIASSSARGMSMMTTAPTAGMRIVSVNAHESNQFIETSPLRLREDPQRQGEQPHRDDQEQGVELQPTGLDPAERAA